MAYSSSGKKVYISIKDLPQYTSIGNGDKIIIWNETRDGAAVVDYNDLKIDLDHTTFKSTINEVITLASDIQTFAHTVDEEISGLQDTVNELQDTVNKELKSRIKSLEFIVAVILGANSYWSTKAGLDNLRSKFLSTGISQGSISGSADDDSEEVKEVWKWYNGLMSTITSYVSKITPGVENDSVLLQSKFGYRYTDSGISAAPTQSTASIKMTTTDSNGDTTTTNTTISYQ